MANTERALREITAERLYERAQLAGHLPHVDNVAVVHNGDARAIVAAVFQAGQPF
jgi:hypothetical protein